MRGSEYTDHIEKLLNWLLDKQNSDGSWNEVHVNYNHPSALITSIVGEALVDGYLLLKNERLNGGLPGKRLCAGKPDISRLF